jgi:hypothetical protein
VIWGLVPPHGNESCRWEAWDGRWVSLELGTDADLGSVIVADSTGRRELVASYEEALALAKSWRVE